LIARYSFGTVSEFFNRIVKVQNRYMAREITFYNGDHKILSATIDSVTSLSPSDPALIPPTDLMPAKNSDTTTPIAAGVIAGMNINKEIPVYPEDAKAARISGTVTLQAVVGRDGGIHDLRVVSAPWPSLVASALWAVSHWQYKPYMLNGEPVEVETTINVIYGFGN
jgi:TonB family protein